MPCLSAELLKEERSKFCPCQKAMTAKVEQHERLHCCISHEFVAAASRAPTSIAVVHASGGARISRELRFREDFSGDDARCSYFTESARSLSPPVYEGDECFTFSELSMAVDSLSRRLRAILDGGDDPHLCRPSGPVNDFTKQYSFVPSSPQLSSDSYVPKVVGIYIPPSVDYIVSVLSVLRCGAAFLPIDPWWPKERILSAISSSKVELIVGSRTAFGKSYDKQWILESKSCPVLWFSMDYGFEELQSECSIVFPCDYEKKRLFCYLMFTSGSTGNPKGVCGTEQGLLNRFLWMQEYYPPQKEEYLLFKTSISFIDHLQELLGAVLTASMLVVPPSNELKENVFAVVEFVEAYRISRLTAVPSLMRAVLPALQRIIQFKNSLRLLILSGEDFPISLWKMLSTLLPSTSILNIYGSTELSHLPIRLVLLQAIYSFVFWTIWREEVLREVSGDCTCFDCKWLPSILDKEREILTSVPIGQSISKCEVVLVGQPDIPEDQGEIYVGGTCLSVGCFCDSRAVQSDFVELHQGSASEYVGLGNFLFFRTGDLARRLSNGDLTFLGRKDRIVKINGQRIALEEIESTLREHLDIANAVVLSCKGQDELVFLEAFVLLKEKNKSRNMSKYLRRWLVDKITSVMIPRHFVFLESFPLTLTGKVDYEFLSTLETIRANEEACCIEDADLLEFIKDAFCDALMVEEVCDEDDFFTIGGNSIAAAHVCHNLGINMKVLYDFPSPSKLRETLLQMEGSDGLKLKMDALPRTGLGVGKRKKFELADSEVSELLGIEQKKKLMRNISRKNGMHDVYPKHFKAGVDTASTSGDVGTSDVCRWRFQAKNTAFSLSRCNRVMYESCHGLKDGHLGSESVSIQRNVKSFIQRLWKVHMESCVDASPLLVAWDQEIYAFVGSHAHKFVCVNAKSGLVRWEINLDGRIECSAAITDDFSQIVVGCYKGKIYFLDFLSGKVRWTFQTAGEVKSQPAVDRNRQLIWCGSHDCNLYALDYKNYQCIFRIACKGSIFGSPAIDELNSTIYVASTGGFVTAVSVKGSTFYVLWQREVEVPVFGSICICPHSSNVICCLVDGSVIALDSSGAISWKTITDGPIFAGPSISSVLPSQALICSRSGKLLSLNTVNGSLNWEYNVGEPMTASAYIDEHLQLMSDRLVCICTSSGSVIVLRIRSDTVGDEMVEEFSRLKLEGDIFSSPVMLDGLIFVGCRDDYLHCLSVETRTLSVQLEW